MYTRAQYMAKEVSHHEYYGQFVTPQIAEAVRQFLAREGWDDPAKAIAVDPHLNQIRLKHWDRLAGDVFGVYYTDGYGKPSGYSGALNRTGTEFVRKLSEAGDSFSASEMVCTLKAAARRE